MSTIVVGTVQMSNGQVPNFYNETNGSLIKNEKTVNYQVKIINGHIFVEYDDPFQNEDVDEIFRTTRYLLDTTILSVILSEKVGLLCSLESCKLESGEIISAIPDRAPTTEKLVFSQHDLLSFIGKRPRLRYAIRDLNQGLLNREDCPFFFFRAIETLAKEVCDKERLVKKDWDSFIYH